MKEKRVVLIGAQAQGKTTFFNSITKQAQKTQYQGQSCTRQIISANTAYGQGFKIIDTPGFNSSEDKLLHVAGILAALTSGEVNRILMVTKYDRDDSIINNLELVFRPINRYRQIVTVILSHWDCCEKGQEKQEQIRIKELIDKKFQIQSIVFYSKNNNPEINCLELEQILYTNNQQVKVTINDSEIFSYFELLELDCENENLLSQHKTKILIEFRKICNQYIKFIKNQEKTNPLFVNILFEITIKIKVEANMKVEEFEKKCGEEIAKMVDKHKNNLHYLHYIEMKKQISNDVEKVTKLAQSRMKESQTHIYNFLKKCPYCNEVWLKVTGCNGRTRCGSQVNQKNDVFLQFEPKKKVEILKDQNNELCVKVNNQITQSQEFIQQIIANIQQSSYLKENLTKPDDMKKILQKIYGEKFQEIIIQKLLNGELENQELLRTIESKLKENIKPPQGTPQKSVTKINTQHQQNIIQEFNPQSLHFNVRPYAQQNSQQQLPSQISIEQYQQQQQRFQYPPRVQTSQTTQQFYNNSINNLNTNSNNNLNNNSNAGQKKQKSIGCGGEIDWGELPPLTSEELNQLYCPGLFDYFANQSKIEQEEEIYWLNKAYKDILTEAIKDQSINIVKLKCPNQNQQIPIIQT